MRRWRPARLRPGPSRLLGHRPRCPTPGQELSSAELRYFTDVDHHDHEALGTLNHPGGAVSVSPVTSATPTTPQGRALGTELVAQLCQQSGITVCA
jgi:hypothetical protein